MGGLAALAAEAGHRVTGCDAAVYPPMSDQLKRLGIEIVEGYGEDQLALKPDVYVIGNVVSRARNAQGEPKFPLMEAILNEGLPYTSGPQWLAEHVLQGRHVLAVAGTHGKTTTTAMLTWILEQAGLNPGFLIGGVAQNFGQSARLGACRSEPRRSLFVIEADEYDTAFFDKRSKFVHYRPRTAILNNLEFDHADIFDDLAAIERQFAHLLRTVPANGLVVSHGNTPALERALAQGVWTPVQRFGGTDGEWTAEGPDHAFDVCHHGQVVGHVAWDIQGKHNQDNALAAIAAAAHAGVSPDQAAGALATFKNVKRRMELRAELAFRDGSVAIYDDFAHHPSAIATTLEGLRTRLDRDPVTAASRIVAVFEPRSNTMKIGTMKAQLPAALACADLAICHTGGLTWDAAEALQPMGDKAVCANDIDTTVAVLMAHLLPGDQIVCMSNGGFGGIHERLKTAIQAAQALSQA
ncbi:MAG: UDP-N-acetylmuramate:L-alanyl-gamma-D-glutamyl-meso-diaminopimelate ligase [Pseudomonadota bacterium]